MSLYCIAVAASTQKPNRCLATRRMMQIAPLQHSRVYTANNATFNDAIILTAPGLPSRLLNVRFAVL